MRLCLYNPIPALTGLMSQEENLIYVLGIGLNEIDWSSVRTMDNPKRARS